MKYLVFIILIPTLFSCVENNTQPKPVDKAVESSLPQPALLTFYKCNYLNKNYDTVLSGGSNVIGEVWGIDKSDIAKLPQVSLDKLDTNAIIKNAEAHLRKRFVGINLDFFNFKVQNIGKDVASRNPRGQYIIVSFLTDKRGYYQLVPLLLDGRVILSDQE